MTCVILSDSVEVCCSKTTAASLIDSGKNYLFDRDIPKAVSELSIACELLAKEFGETAEECGEAYLYYGKALLELSRLESDVLGNALEGFNMEAGDCEVTDDAQIEDPLKMTADEKWDVEEKVAEALEENFEIFDRIAKIHMGSTESEEDCEEEDMDEDGDPKETDAVASAGIAADLDPTITGEMSIDECSKQGIDGKNGEGEEVEDDIEAEDASNLQLAWEMLELAKVSFGKTLEKSTGEKRSEAEVKICMAILGLGEVGVENENYGQAVEEFRQCLERRKAVLPADSRSIAEVHYQLGMALGFLRQFTEAESSLVDAISVLETREKNLKNMEASETVDQELAELTTLVGEIKETIAEHKEMSKEKVEENPGFPESGDGKPISSIAIKRTEPNLAELAKTELSAGPATA